MSYYNLEQTLTILKENLPKALLPFELPQLADLCRRGELTPVFAYDKYAMYLEICTDRGEFPNTQSIDIYKGYLTNESLTKLLDKSEDKIVLTRALTYEVMSDSPKKDRSYEMVLVANPFNIHRYKRDDSYTVYSDDDPFPVTRESLLFPSKQVQNYIASKQTKEQTTPEQQRIAELEKLLEQAYADNEKPKQQTNMPADDNIEQDHLYNWQAMDKNQYPPELHLAIEIWKEYYQADVVEHITQFDSGRFNRISTKLNLSKGNLKNRVRTLLTPLNSKARSPELLSSLEAINIIHNDKLEQD